MERESPAVEFVSEDGISFTLKMNGQIIGPTSGGVTIEANGKEIIVKPILLAVNNELKERLHG